MTREDCLQGWGPFFLFSAGALLHPTNPKLLHPIFDLHPVFRVLDCEVLCYLLAEAVPIQPCVIPSFLRTNCPPFGASSQHSPPHFLHPPPHPLLPIVAEQDAGPTWQDCAEVSRSPFPRAARVEWPGLWEKGLKRSYGFALSA